MTKIAHEKPASELLELFLESRQDTCSARSIATYRYYLAPYVTFLAGEQITHSTVRAHLAAVKARGVSPETVRNTYLRLKLWCAWLQADGLLLVNPFVGKGRVQPPQRRRELRVVYSQADIVQLLEATYRAVPSPNCRTPDYPIRTRRNPDGGLEREPLQARALVLLLLDSGLRAEEACRLTCGDVRAEQRRVLGKGGTILPWFATEATLAVLRELADGRPDADPLFRDWWGGPCTTRALRGVLERLADRAGVTLPPRPLHAWRHVAARLWKAAGLSDFTIMDLLRHASLSSTAIYVRGSDEQSLVRHHARVSPVAELLSEARSRAA